MIILKFQFFKMKRYIIDRTKEEIFISRICEKLVKNKKFHIHKDKTLLINLDPYYSSVFSQIASHTLGENNEPINMLFVEIPETDQNYLPFELKFEEVFKQYYSDYENFLIINLYNKKGANNFKWLLNTMKKFNVKDEKIITCSLIESMGNEFRCDTVGFYINEDKDEIKFYFEKNRNDD